MRTRWIRTEVTTAFIAVSLLIAPAVRGNEQTSAGPDIGTGHVIRLTPAELKWIAGPPVLPPGASMAVIEGSFSTPGPFTVRLKFPANYRIPAHWHPIKVTVTVISGTFHMGFGDELDTGRGKTLPAGSIFEMPARIHHFGWTSEETIIQEHGVGPLSVNYLGPTHDGRHR